MDKKLKCLLLGVVFLIDFLHFEKQSELTINGPGWKPLNRVIRKLVYYEPTGVVVLPVPHLSMNKWVILLICVNV